MKKILIKNALIVPMEQEVYDEENSCFLGEIAIEGNEIIYVGSLEGTLNFNADRIIDGTGMVAMPGLINAHTHAAMSLLRGYADDLPLMEWLEKRIWPLEEKLVEEDVYWGTKLSILEMLKAGITTFADMYFFMDEVAKAVAETGIRASLARGMTSGSGSDLAMEESIALFKKWHGFDNNRITTMLGPHAPYTCSPDFIEEIIAKGNEYDLGIHIHLAETKAEMERIKKQYGKPPVELMRDLGLFSRPVLAAHCVCLEPHETDILVENKVRIVHNPKSNMKLASGIAPIPKLLEKGATIALGTDGPASNNNLDILSEIRTAALLHKVSSLEPTAINAYQALSMATREGAKALGLKNVGVLKKGYKADIILLDFQKPHLYPHHNIIAHLVYSVQASDVEMVLIDGQVVMENGQVLTMDEKETIQKAIESAKRIAS